MSLCAGCGAAADEAPVAQDPAQERGAASSTVEPEDGALSIEVSFAGAVRAPLVAWLSPLLTSSGWGCPSSCASSPSDCVEECQPGWLATGATEEWPGVSRVQLERVPAGSYWLFAHLSRELPADLLPRSGDPVSRGAPRVVEISPGKMASIALTFDATFTTRQAERAPPCAERLEAALPRLEPGTKDVEDRSANGTLPQCLGRSAARCSVACPAAR